MLVVLVFDVTRTSPHRSADACSRAPSLRARSPATSLASGGGRQYRAAAEQRTWLPPLESWELTIHLYRPGAQPSAVRSISSTKQQPAATPRLVAKRRPRRHRRADECDRASRPSPGRGCPRIPGSGRRLGVDHLHRQNRSERFRRAGCPRGASPRIGMSPTSITRTNGPFRPEAIVI